MSQDNFKAFPYTGAGSDGMDLRDYFAAKAMQGLLASDTFAPVAEFARRAYEVADAMMEERISHE
jgi:hypothetical protein